MNSANGECCVVRLGRTWYEDEVAVEEMDLTGHYSIWHHVAIEHLFPSWIAIPFLGKDEPAGVEGEDAGRARRIKRKQREASARGH